MSLNLHGQAFPDYFGREFPRESSVATHEHTNCNDNMHGLWGSVTDRKRGPNPSHGLAQTRFKACYYSKGRYFRMWKLKLCGDFTLRCEVITVKERIQFGSTVSTESPTIKTPSFRCEFKSGLASVHYTLVKSLLFYLCTSLRNVSGNVKGQPEPSQSGLS